MLKLKTVDKKHFSLDDAVSSAPVTIVVTFRGTWCPFCQEYLEALADREDDFKEIGAQVIAISAESAKALRRFKRHRNWPFTLVSDRKNTAKKVLGVETEAYHPNSFDYPKGAFLQPSAFVWTQDGKLHYQWVQKPSFEGVFGAAKRPSAKKLLRRAQRALIPPEVEAGAEDDAADASAAP